MKNKKILSACLFGACAAMSLAFTSCGDQFQEEYPWMVGRQEEVSNEDDDGEGARNMDILERELRGAIGYMINYTNGTGDSWTPHAYQYNRTNNIDEYAGYWTIAKSNFAFGPALATLYTDNHGYMGGPCDNTIFTQSYNAIHYAATMKDNGGEADMNRPEWRALALIIQAYAAHEIIDFYGVMPFTDWRNRKRTTPLTYESGQDVYKQIFADLDEAIATLKERQPSQGDMQRVEGTEAHRTAFDWDWRRLVKFANSIKLRMAMNMVDYTEGGTYGPDNKSFNAKSIAEEAVADEIGVLTENDRDIAYNITGTTITCVWYFISNGWGDIRVNASIENIMKHFNNPLLTVWFDPSPRPINSNLASSGKVNGIRGGLLIKTAGMITGTNGYAPCSILAAAQEHMAEPFMKSVEVMFLRAEGALRGWTMGGTAKDFYEKAIRHEMSAFGVSSSDIDSYLAQTNLPAVEYTDYYQARYSCDGRVTCDVKWDESDSNELKLEKIITQKWIHNFPMGAEAWTTFRRTGYPRLFPPVVNNHTGVDTELQIRRMTYTPSADNAAEIAQIQQLLGGTQTAGDHVFWDVNSRSWTKDSEGKYIPDNHL